MFGLRYFFWGVLLLAGPAAGIATAADFPSGPVTMVIPYSPGGVTDTVGRLLARAMGKGLGTTVLVENKAGASGAIGSAHVARAKPDGQTIAFVSNGPITIMPHLGDMSFDPTRDLQPISVIVINQLGLVTGRSRDFRTFENLLSFAKANPNVLKFGTSGVGGPGHLAGELLQQMAGIKLVHVPYGGDSAAVADVTAGHIDMSFSAVPAIQGLVDTGSLKVLAAVGSSRVNIWPDVPMISESGVSGYAADAWQGMFVPAGTPKATVERIHQAVMSALADPEIRGKISSGNVVVGNSPAEMVDFIRSDSDKWKAIIEKANVKLK